MTIGQRIAQKRKESGLSQEGLGEQLGVSRQAIYKWESDACLPEIDKLITLSKIFSVSVGWLLGVEEDAPPQRENSGELTETQLQMVREIVDGYLAAQPAPAPPKRRRLVRLCTAAAAAALLAALFSLFSKLDQVNRDFNGLYLSVNNISRNVNSQIGSITSRVEDILKSQNDLTADWSAQLVSTDLRANTATFDVRVVPRTYVEGMTALFQAVSGEGTVELPVEPGAGHAFAGQITCPLTDSISLTVVLVTDGKRETQWLDDFDWLYTSTFPDLDLDSWLWSEKPDAAGVLPVKESSGVTVRSIEDRSGPLGFRPDPPARLQVGLFRDRELVVWYEEQERNINYNGAPAKEYTWVRTQDVTLEPGCTYCEAAVYTDEFGRQRVYSTPGLSVTSGGGGTLNVEHQAVYVDEADPAQWKF
ncbi:helix-turn-helix domain-containing protein [Flintibacter muris]|uniref:helix-turn-helix domain-containing protein n=1 Tax=Flintibacter muris TaxID=2941327 RepID=UPI0020411A9B|nr:helix-turn-helix domain-containing protein [Flintibacter muris]